MRPRSLKYMHSRAVAEFLEETPESHDMGTKHEKSQPYDEAVDLLVGALPKLNAKEIEALRTVLRDVRKAQSK